MESMNVQLPASLKGLVERRAAQRGYVDSSEYLAALIREDIRDTADDDQYGLLIDEGFDSGDARELTPYDWSALRADVIRSVEVEGK